MRSVFRRTILSCLALALATANAGATNFTNFVIFNGTNGNDPVAGLVLLGSTLYGTTLRGGTNGTLFAVRTDGTGFTNLHYFNGSDGSGPGPLAFSGNVLYGTSGGSNNNGTIFAINADGTGFTNLFNFDGTNGNGIPSLVSMGDVLFGTTVLGENGVGTAFAINTDGTGFTNLYIGTFSKGVCPHAAPVIFGNTLYGTMQQGGTTGYGTVFAMNTDGTAYTNLYNFSIPHSGGPSGSYLNSDGYYPEQALVLSGSTLYGTTAQGGSQGAGTIFRVNTDGTDFTNLYNFPNNGYYPVHSTSSLVLSGNGNVLYGGADYGTVFAINTDGTGITNLVYGGSQPVVGLVLSGHTLYGTQSGGYQNDGTVFALTLPAPSLNIQLTNGAIILQWNDPTSTYSLQAAPNLDGVYTNVPGAADPYANAITSSQVFFRLESN